MRCWEENRTEDRSGEEEEEENRRRKRMRRKEGKIDQKSIV